jgi:hypothetical protein
MSLPDDDLSVLIDQLKSLPAADRRAVLRRFSTAERARIEALLRGGDQVDTSPSPFSAAIATRVAQASAPSASETFSVPMTAAGLAALRNAVGTLDSGPGNPAARRDPVTGGSLMDSFAGLLRAGNRSR